MLVVLTGCTSFVGAPHIRTNGELAGGFEIEPGTALLGTVFPVPWGGWRAVLRVDRDGREVYDRYAAQAADLGWPVRRSDAEGRAASSTAGPRRRCTARAQNRSESAASSWTCARRTTTGAGTCSSRPST